jgi:hypothetical protein
VNDTIAEVDAAYRERFASLSPLERLVMMSDMFDTARALMEAGIRAGRPDVSARDLRVEMFRRLYWNDFDEATMARFVQSLVRR